LPGAVFHDEASADVLQRQDWRPGRSSRYGNMDKVIGPKGVESRKRADSLSFVR
jgi:hypothetical protein